MIGNHSPMSEPSPLSALPSQIGKTAIWAPGVAMQIADSAVFPINENSPIVSTPLVFDGSSGLLQIRCFPLQSRIVLRCHPGFGSFQWVVGVLDVSDNFHSNGAQYHESCRICYSFQ